MRDLVFWVLLWLLPMAAGIAIVCGFRFLGVWALLTILCASGLRLLSLLFHRPF